MDHPDGLKEDNDYVCRLNRSLYGLKQASRCWYMKFTNLMKEKQFQCSESDNCLFIKHSNTTITYLLLYVDDLLVASSDNKEIDIVMKDVEREFEMSVQENGLFLGMKITHDHDKRELSIDRRHYIDKLLIKFNMYECKPVRTPIEHCLKLKVTENCIKATKPYKEAIECLMYLTTHSRPDICYAVNLLSRYQINHTDTYWEYVKRIMRYLKYT